MCMYICINVYYMYGYRHVLCLCIYVCMQKVDGKVDGYIMNLDSMTFIGGDFGAFRHCLEIGERKRNLTKWKLIFTFNK